MTTTWDELREQLDREYEEEQREWDQLPDELKRPAIENAMSCLIDLTARMRASEARKAKP